MYAGFIGTSACRIGGYNGGRAAKELDQMVQFDVGHYLRLSVDSSASVV